MLTMMKMEGGRPTPRIPALWVFALLAVSAVAGVMGIFWLKKVSPILQVERRHESIVALAKAKGLEPTTLMAVCVTEKAFAGEKARPDADLAERLVELLAASPKPKSKPRSPKRPKGAKGKQNAQGAGERKPIGPSPEQRAWKHKVLQELLGSHEAASFAYDLEERHRVRWRALIAEQRGKGS